MASSVCLAIAVTWLYSSSSLTSLPIVPLPLRIPSEICAASAVISAPDAAIAPYLEYVASGIVMVEGYAQQGSPDEQYLRSRARALIVRDYLVGTFHLDAQATGAMPLSADSTGSPGKALWDGVALAVILPKDALTPSGSR